MDGHILFYKDDKSKAISSASRFLSLLSYFTVKVMSCKKPQKAYFSCANEIREVCLYLQQTSVHFKGRESLTEFVWTEQKENKCYFYGLQQTQKIRNVKQISLKARVSM